MTVCNIISIRTLSNHTFKAMKTVSHIMIALSTLILLLFGSGGIGWQRCACTGKVSLVLPTQHDCCKRGSKCMTVTITHLSTADLQQETSTPTAQTSDLFGNLFAIPNTQHPTPISQFFALPTGHIYWFPPGWTDSRNMVMRV